MIRFAFIFILAFRMLAPAGAQDHQLSALEVMTENDRQMIADDEYFMIRMTLVNKRGGERKRQLEQYTMTDSDNNRSSLIKFLAPADIKGTGLLSIEHSSRDDDQWLYLPAFNKTRRISPSNESDYFVGTDFTFEDLNREDLEDFDYSFLADTSFEGAACYHILAVPVSDSKLKESGYSKREMLIRKVDFILVSVEFYDRSGELQKIYKSGDIKKIGDKHRAYRMKMKTLKSGHKTILIFNEIKLNQGVDREVFTERYLMRE